MVHLMPVTKSYAVLSKVVHGLACLFWKKCTTSWVWIVTQSSRTRSTGCHHIRMLLRKVNTKWLILFWSDFTFLPSGKVVCFGSFNLQSSKKLFWFQNHSSLLLLSIFKMVFFQSLKTCQEQSKKVSDVRLIAIG